MVIHDLLLAIQFSFRDTPLMSAMHETAFDLEEGVIPLPEPPSLQQRAELVPAWSQFLQAGSPHNRICRVAL